MFSTHRALEVDKSTYNTLQYTIYCTMPHAYVGIRGDVVQGFSDSPEHGLVSCSASVLRCGLLQEGSRDKSHCGNPLLGVSTLHLGELMWCPTSAAKGRNACNSDNINQKTCVCPSQSDLSVSLPQPSGTCRLSTVFCSLERLELTPWSQITATENTRLK